MQHPTMNVYLGLIGFVIFVMAIYLCLPKIDQFIKYLEGKGQQDGQEAAHH